MTSDLRLLRSTGARVGVAVAIVVAAATPLFISSDFWMSVFVAAGVFALGGLGLNLLTGYTGQASLGHAAFILIGAYTAAWFGADQGWPLPLWMLASMLAAGLVGAAIGPFALRFKGNYLVVVTLALIFITVHVLQNWESFSGGFNGKSTGGAELSFIVDFENLSILGKDFTPEQGLYYLTWIIVGVATLLVANIVRTRPGRALQAIRDRDVAAEVIGIHVARNKVIVFALSSAMAGLAGGLDAVRVGFLTPGVAESQLLLSIRFVAVIVVGGVGTIIGALVGALFLGPLPELVEEFSEKINFTVPIIDEPLLKESATSDGIMSNAVFAEILFSLMLVLFLMFQPRGLVGMWHQLRSRFGRATGTAVTADDDTPDPEPTPAQR
ncbi:MAG: branched-chain amino acid ABC transporter permease [Acidimicrobiales bacterium]